LEVAVWTSKPIDKTLNLPKSPNIKIETKTKSHWEERNKDRKSFIENNQSNANINGNIKEKKKLFLTNKSLQTHKKINPEKTNNKNVNSKVNTPKYW